ncbi:MAG: tetratricopeptide repeat protein [Elusimicrobia bacterium]|nr:tetratricopeptide repeat protein [Elusimicrobiota bacterium]
MTPRVLASFLIAGSGALCFGSEVEEAFRGAFIDFLEGGYEKTASAYRYLETIGAGDASHSANLALTLRDEGRPDEAVANWLKATLLSPQDPFYWNQRGWNYLAIGQLKEARDSFRKSVEISTGPQTAAEAYFGVGLAESIDGNLKAAYRPLQSALAQSPYLAPAVAGELGRITMRQRHYPQAVPFFTMSLAQDPSQSDMAKELGRAYEKTGQGLAAWQAYKLALDLDPSGEFALKRRDALAKALDRPPAENMPLRRLARPLMREPSEAAAAKSAASSPLLRVLLYANQLGSPAHLTHFFFMSSTHTLIVDMKTGEVARSKALTQWEVVFKPDNRVIEIRDTSNAVQYVTRQPFRLEPAESWGTVLIKNPETGEIKGVDISDREFRGVIEIQPTPMGFHVVNEVPIEEYLPSIVNDVLPADSPLEAYKAMAVFLRSRASAAIARPPDNPERSHLCDSVRDIPYDGVAGESEVATNGVRRTQGVGLLTAGAAAMEFHKSCGWETEAFIQDRAAPALPLGSPLDLERLIHYFPDPKQFDEASARVPAIWNRWVRVFSAAELRSNLERALSVGPIRTVRIKRRAPTGRVLALEISGARGQALLQGEAEIQAFLSPGSLRSTIFTLQPLYQGREISHLIVWGAGTGHGRGLCVAGAVGQAQLGRSFKTILLHYFPGASLPGYQEPPPKMSVETPRLKPRKAPSPKAAPSGRGKTSPSGDGPNIENASVGAVPNQRRMDVRDGASQSASAPAAAVQPSAGQEETKGQGFPSSHKRRHRKK